MMEFRSAEAPLDPRRIRAVVNAARPMFTGIDWQDRKEEWVGPRPCTPDGLPLIGATRSPRVFVGGGHGMWGITLGPLTGKFLADTITGHEPTRADEALRPAALSGIRAWAHPDPDEPGHLGPVLHGRAEEHVLRAHPQIAGGRPVHDEFLLGLAVPGDAYRLVNAALEVPVGSRDVHSPIVPGQRKVRNVLDAAEASRHPTAEMPAIPPM